MNGIHDMGGMHGFGPIRRDPHEPVFHQAWEGRLFAIRQATPIPIPGGSRNNIEQMHPADYLTTSYYEKWLHAQVKGLLDAGVLTETELEERTALYRDHPEAEVPRREDPVGVQRFLARLHQLESPLRDHDIQPAFNIGDAIRVRNLHPSGHTRLPRYVRGKPGVVTRYYGLYDFQDAMPGDAAQPEAPQPLYAVRFKGQDLWGNASQTNSVVYLDMWESYLQSA